MVLSQFEGDNVAFAGSGGQQLRNPLYFVYPVASSSIRREELTWVRDVLRQFDGIRSIAIAFDQHTVHPDEVGQLFAETTIDHWWIRRNDSRLQEAACIVELLETVQQAPGITWYGHAKGVSRDDLPVVRNWAQACHSITLGYPGLIERHLEHSLNCGAFCKIEPHRIGTEAYPSTQFHLNESRCLFLDEALNLYSPAYWQSAVTPQYLEFQQAHQSEALSHLVSLFQELPVEGTLQ